MQAHIQLLETSAPPSLRDRHTPSGELRHCELAAILLNAFDSLCPLPTGLCRGQEEISYECVLKVRADHPQLSYRSLVPLSHYPLLFSPLPSSPSSSNPFIPSSSSSFLSFFPFPSSPHQSFLSFSLLPSPILLPPPLTNPSPSSPHQSFSLLPSPILLPPPLTNPFPSSSPLLPPLFNPSFLSLSSPSPPPFLTITPVLTTISWRRSQTSCFQTFFR